MALGTYQELPTCDGCRLLLSIRCRHGWGCRALWNLANQWAEFILFNFRGVCNWLSTLSASRAFLSSMTWLVRLYSFCLVWDGAQILEAILLTVARVFGHDRGVTYFWGSVYSVVLRLDVIPYQFMLSMIGRLALIMLMLVAAIPSVNYVTEVLRLIVNARRVVHDRCLQRRRVQRRGLTLICDVHGLWVVSVRGISLLARLFRHKTVLLVDLLALWDFDHAVRPHLGVFSQHKVSFAEVFDFVNKHF